MNITEIFLTGLFSLKRSSTKPNVVSLLVKTLNLSLTKFISVTNICSTYLLCGKDTLKAANKVRLIAETEMPLRPLIQRKQIQQQPIKSKVPHNLHVLQTKSFCKQCRKLKASVTGYPVVLISVACGFLKETFRSEDEDDYESISSPEPTCLLVSTKTRSSGIINKLVPRALVFFAFKIWSCCSFKARFRLSLFFQYVLNAFVERIHIDFISRRHLNQAMHAPWGRKS